MATALIQERGTISGNQPRMQRIGEDATQTFLAGTPLQINPVNGFLKAWDGVTISRGIAGIAKEFGANLANANTAQQQTFGSVQNESAAVNISRPYFNDGMTGIVLVDQDTQFYAQVGPAQTTAQTDVGQLYGMTKDTDGHWYVDKNKTGASAVCTVIGLDYYDTTRGVIITFTEGARQLPA